MARFRQYIGIDYSGASSPDHGLAALRIFRSEDGGEPAEVLRPGDPPFAPRRNWSRKTIAAWLEERLAEDVPTLVGIDHGFSFPLAYFERQRLARDWRGCLDDFVRHWPTDQPYVYVESILEGRRGDARRRGDAAWLRLTERWSSSAGSVFRFTGQGCVGKSTHAGLPWLRRLAGGAAGRVHIWPFDGWDPPAGSSVVAEVYPSIWSKRVPRARRNGDQQDAFAVAAWLGRADHDGSLEMMLAPPLTKDEREQAQVEGWILGIY